MDRSKKLSVNDKVEILRKDIKVLSHRKRPLYGRVLKIDGEYIYVRPNNCRFQLELYSCEIRKYT